MFMLQSFPGLFFPDEEASRRNSPQTAMQQFAASDDMNFLRRKK
jgi:hypothetical protein